MSNTYDPNSFRDDFRKLNKEQKHSVLNLAKLLDEEERVKNIINEEPPEYKEGHVEDDLPGRE